MTEKIENNNKTEEKNISEKFSILCKEKHKKFKKCQTNDNHYFYSMCEKSYFESKDFCEANGMKLISTDSSEFWKKERSKNFGCMKNLWKFWVDFTSCDNKEFINVIKHGQENCELKIKKIQNSKNSKSSALMAKRDNHGGINFKIIKRNKKKRFVCVKNIINKIKETAPEVTTNKVPESVSKINQFTSNSVKPTTKTTKFTNKVYTSSKNMFLTSTNQQKETTQVKSILYKTNLVNTEPKVKNYAISPPTYIIPIACIFVVIIVALFYRKTYKKYDQKKPKNAETVSSELECIVKYSSTEDVIFENI